MRVRLAAVAVALLAAILVLAGCVVFQSPPTGAQQDVIGPMRITETICASEPDSGSPSHPGCPNRGNSNNTASDGTGQALLAFRIPVGAGSPASFHSTAGEALTFTRSASYAEQLNTLVPPPSGQVWVGYISQVYTLDSGSDGTPAKQSTVAVDFALPHAAHGAPFAGPFKVRPVVGVRQVSDPDLPANRPVACGDRPFGGSTDTRCIDDPDKDTTATNMSFATEDLGIAGKRATAKAGKTTPIHFTAKWAGAADSNARFTLSASSTLHGASATPSPSSLTPAANSSNPVTVALKVPRKRHGSYTVTLRARLANGQARTATVRVRVPNTNPPHVSHLALHPRTFSTFSAPISAARAHGTRISFQLTKRARVRFTVKRVKGKHLRTIGHFSVRGDAGANHFHFTGYVDGKRLEPGRYRLGAKPTDSGGRSGGTPHARFTVAR